MIDPKNDGIDHINVYSKATTELGLFLSNFALAPIETEDGPFKSIEGYWYWLGTRALDKDQLRYLYGFQAKNYGSRLDPLERREPEDFKEKIKKAITTKITTSRFLMTFILSTLPFKHYYVYGNKYIEGKYSIVEPKDSTWIVDFLEELRHNLKNEVEKWTSST